MSCGYCDAGDGDSGRIWETRPKARKEYRCYECGRIIKPGEVYTRIKVVCGGDFYTFKTCAQCAEIGDKYTASYDFGRLWESLEECFEGEGMLDGRELTLSPAARDALFEAIEEMWARWDTIS